MSKKELKTIPPKGIIRMHMYNADNGGCGYIRNIFPSLLLNQYRYKQMNFDVTYGSHFINDLNFYKSMSILKFQRSATSDHLKLIAMAKNIRQQTYFGIIYETDDLLTADIPKTNHAHTYYKNNWPYIEQMLHMVDGLTVSTQTLKKELLKYNTNIQVTQNHLVKWLWEQQDAKQKIENKNSNKIRILWAGSQNHFNSEGKGGDFGEVLIDFIKKTTDIYDWVLVGARPYELLNEESIEFHPWQNIMEFGRYLNSLNCDIGIAPLEKNIFNDCKSNIKSLEFASLGIAGVYSACDPYMNMTNTCINEEEMISKIEALAKDENLRYNTWLNDYNTVKEDLYWNDDNLKKYIDKHLKIFNKKLG